MTTHILASRTMRAQYHHVTAGNMQTGYPRTVLVAVLHTNSGDRFGVGMDQFHRAELSPDTVRLVRHAGFTPAGNEMVVYADIPRAAYDDLVAAAAHRFPYPLRLNEKVIELAGEEVRPAYEPPRLTTYGATMTGNA